MAKSDITAVLALVAALFIAISDAVQQRLASDVTKERVDAIALFSRLVRNPRWWLGSLVAAVGFALEAAALGLGSVVLVQALFVTSLLFCAADQRQARPSQGDPLGVDLGGAVGGRRGRARYRG